METKKMLDKNGLEYYTGKIKQQIPKKTSDLTNDSNFIDNTYHDNSKQDTLVSGTNIKTINNESLLGSGDISVATTSDIPTKVSDLTNDSGFIDRLVILSYGSSTWNDFITAYNKNKVVYCRASSNSNPASGSQTRLAFMAYVNNAEHPTEVEFQYYRSVSSHTITQQGDQVFVYKLNKTNGWSVLSRQTMANIDASGGLTRSYSGNKLTISGAGKQDTLVSGTNIKTINNASVLGSGNIEIEAGACVEQSSTAPTDTDIVLWIEDSDIDGSGGGGGTSIEVIDSLVSTSTTNALSANQGRVLNGKITTIESDYLTSTNIKDNLTTDSATDALSAKQGKLLDTRVSALEGDNLDSRLDTLEGQNLDTRLDTIEAKNLVESTNISKIVMVTEYPSTPDPDTLYVKVASL